MTMAMCFIINETMIESFCHKIGSVQYNGALTIRGMIKGTSQINFSNELELESLKFKCWFRNLCLFFKIKKHGLLEYVFNIRVIINIILKQLRIFQHVIAVQKFVLLPKLN